MSALRVGRVRWLLGVVVLGAACFSVGALQEPAQKADHASSMTEGQKKQADAEAQRKAEMAADTAKLLQLANELKAEMDKTSKDTLSLSVMKKADEIERLARKVRGEMKASLGN